MSNEFEEQGGRYSLTGATTSSSGNALSKRRRSITRGSIGRCKSLDMAWLLSLKSKTQHHMTTPTEEGKLMEKLIREEHFTIGLARTLIRNTKQVALSCWLLDNSGSLNNTDGHVVVHDLSDDKIRNIACTRWEECTSTLMWHAELHAKLHAPMVIRLVNDPGSNVGPQQLGVAASQNITVNDELERLRRLLKSHPGGSTPINIHLKDILQSLKNIDTSLLEGKMISIVIVTDRLPTDTEGSEGQDVKFEFLETLKSFQEYPVWILIRLSTDNKSVVEFYSSLDRGIAILRQLRGEADHARVENIQLDVLDDYVNEAKRVYRYNPWLNYGLPLHLTRESCSSLFLAFDLLNERPLNYSELADFCALLFDRQVTLDGVGDMQTLGDDLQPLADPKSDYREFRKIIQQEMKQSGDLWNPLKRKMVPWIDLAVMDRIYGASGKDPITNATVAAAVTPTCSCVIS